MGGGGFETQPIPADQIPFRHQPGRNHRRHKHHQYEQPIVGVNSPIHIILPVRPLPNFDLPLKLMGLAGRIREIDPLRTETYRLRRSRDRLLAKPETNILFRVEYIGSRCQFIEIDPTGP